MPQDEYEEVLEAARTVRELDVDAPWIYLREMLAYHLGTAIDDEGYVDPDALEFARLINKEN